MTWDAFIYFAIAASVLWAAGAWAGWRKKAAWAYALTGTGVGVFLVFIIGLWMGLERPPLRTMGETRMWYSLFLPAVGLLVYGRWRYRWILAFSALMAIVFVCVNILRPEIHDKAMMPALQSPWFVPHVIVYMFSYALFGAAAVASVWFLITKKPEMEMADNLVYAGVAFLTVGMLFGALWAKEAWGHYWGWDPKETWAAATWLSYLLYIHYRLARPRSHKPALWLIILGFILLQICWWGINYLPSASSSVHVYAS